MPCNDPRRSAAARETPPSGSRIGIDELFRRAAQRHPGAIALADPPNRASFTDGAPRRLTYAEADRMVSAIAGRLRRMGLPTDAIVGIQLPNIGENILTILGVMRAGLIAAPLPLLWRRADAVTALARVGAKALITCRRVGNFEHGQFATRVAAEVFSIRYVCGFGGKNLPDGVVPLDDLFTAAKLDPVPPLERQGNPAAHLAVITFEIGEDGPVPVARRHLELLAGGLGVLLESGIEQSASILSTIAPASFAGLCLTLVPWLLTGGTLVLHHPFDADVFAQQRRDDRCGTLILPAVAAFRLAETGLFSREGPTRVLAAWRAPEAACREARIGPSATPRWSMYRSSAKPASSPRGAAWADMRRRLPLGAVVAPRDGGGAGRGDGRRTERHRERHVGAARPDGAASRLSARHRALRPAAFRDRPRRRGRHRLRLPRRSHEQDDHGHRAACRHRHDRRLSLPAVPAAGGRRRASTPAPRSRRCPIR